MKTLNELTQETQETLDDLVKIDKPLLILAGPGMGKTYMLAYKIKYLVKKKNVDPADITVITFTKEAATNMRKRISLEGEEQIYIEPNLQPSVISTMHKLGNGIIKNNYSKLNLEHGFKVLSSDYLKKILLADCAQIVGAEREDARETIACRQNSQCVKTVSLKCRICDEYKSLLRKFNYVDHDDQILLACQLFKDHKKILETERQKIRYLLVDEYQDINYGQWELIKLLSGDNPENLFVVGDDYQSIYGFRGGDPKYIKNFGSDYAPTAVVKHLTISHRCPPSIFKGAFCMAQKYNGGYTDLLEKIKFTNKSDARIKIHNFKHHNLEAGFIAGRIKEIGPSYEVLILVPTIKFAMPIKQALKKRYVDFTCDYDIEETDLYLLGVLLDWLQDPRNSFSLRILIEQIINKKATDMPAKKREETLKIISDFWKEIGEGKTLYLKIKKLISNPLFTNLVDIITELRNLYEKESVSNFISSAINKLKIWKDTSNFLREITSVIDEIKGLTMVGGECSVRILTMKKAKGLQADYVFIVGLENNILPRGDKSKIEDSRLLYVSMTRAKKELYLLHSEVRDKNIAQTQLNGRSEFIDAMPNEYIEIYQ